jgi:ribose transport system ATP-binding protein
MVDSFLEARHITKRFPGVMALDDVSFECRQGEVHAVVGQNGAGKSTLMKIISGAYHPDQGEIILRGNPVRITSPYHAQQLGISTVYQELNLLPDLRVADNVFLGREPHTRLGLIDSQLMEKKSHEALCRLGADINPRTRLGRLSVAKQQIVEIAKALSLNAQLIIMDEPSASLGDQELQHVFEVIKTLKQQGIAIIYISHRLGEVFDIADRVTVFKDGKVVTTCGVQDIDRSAMVKMMTGRALTETFPGRSTKIGEEVIRISNLNCKGLLNDINLSVCAGEIVGIAGLTGAGRSELAQTIFGMRKVDSGEIKINGLPVEINNPADAMKNGIGFVTEDRKKEGLVMGLSVQHNTALPSLERRHIGGFVKKMEEKGVVLLKVKELALKTPSLNQEVQYLSGGGQQKVVLAKWLIRNPALIIFDEPTRGIDVGAKAEIWALMRQLAEKGTAILMISSELPEVIGMSDRIAVMRNGCIAGELEGKTATEEQIMMHSTYGGCDVDN